MVIWRQREKGEPSDPVPQQEAVLTTTAFPLYRSPKISHWPLNPPPSFPFPFTKISGVVLLSIDSVQNYFRQMSTANYSQMTQAAVYGWTWKKTSTISSSRSGNSSRSCMTRNVGPWYSRSSFQHLRELRVLLKSFYSLKKGQALKDHFRSLKT